VELWLILVTAVALSMDAFAVASSVSCSLRVAYVMQAFRMAIHFGFFQTFMAAIGYYLGSAMSKYIGIFDHWIAFGILLFLGIKMIKEARSNESCEEDFQKDPTKGMNMIGLSIATSIDSLAVGASFGIYGLKEIWPPAIIIGITTFLFTAVGFYFGRILRLYLKKWAEMIGGIALIAIGLKILLEGLGFI
jgi:putative Mn2+ efflux pump MntP